MGFWLGCGNNMFNFQVLSNKKQIHQNTNSTFCYSISSFHYNSFWRSLQDHWCFSCSSCCWPTQQLEQWTMYQSFGKTMAMVEIILEGQWNLNVLEIKETRSFLMGQMEELVKSNQMFWNNNFWCLSFCIIIKVLTIAGEYFQVAWLSQGSLWQGDYSVSSFEFILTVKTVELVTFIQSEWEEIWVWRWRGSYRVGLC